MTSSSPPAAPVLRLGTYKLPAAETALIQTLLRLYAQNTASHWIYASAPPYDALLADGSTAEGQSPTLDRLAPIVLRLARRSENTTHDLLERPIRPDRFQQWLQTIEQKLLAQAARAKRENPTRYRLLRWPPASVLRDDADRIRMATLLSRRFLSVQELVSISRQSENICMDFIHMLQEASLLQTQAEAASNPSDSPSDLPAPRKRFFNLKMIQTIRERLHF